MINYITTARATAAAERLNVSLEGLTQLAVEQAFRAAAKKHHPDVGDGDRVAWASIEDAKRALLGWLEHPQSAPLLPAGDCRACGGKGYTQKVPNGLKRSCVICSGTGHHVRHDREQ